MLAANDATDIVPHVDSVILVTHAGRTSAPQAERTVDLLARLAVPVLGVVVQAAAEADGLGPLRRLRRPRTRDERPATRRRSRPPQPATPTPGPQRSTVGSGSRVDAPPRRRGTSMRQRP